jgi:signal transduction histidine kinase
MVLKEQGGPLTDKQKTMLQEAERSCERISALVAQMSDLGRLEGHDLIVARNDVDLAALLVELANGPQEGQDRGIRLELRVPKTPVKVTGDRGRLSVAIATLLHAALRERGEPGVVVVECAVIADTSPAWAVVAVGADNMMPSLLKDARHPALPPFDEWRGGLGLALPIARRLFELLGGALWSTPGDRPHAGAAFRLPLQH